MELRILFLGLIPARAGNTFVVALHLLKLGAHPRSRGEHLLFLSIEFALRGSSPLARGTRVFLLGRGGGVGLIPARAGNTRLPQP